MYRKYMCCLQFRNIFHMICNCINKLSGREVLAGKLQSSTRTFAFILGIIFSRNGMICTKLYACNAIDEII